MRNPPRVTDRAGAKDRIFRFIRMKQDNIGCRPIVPSLPALRLLGRRRDRSASLLFQPEPFSRGLPDGLWNGWACTGSGLAAYLGFRGALPSPAIIPRCRLLRFRRHSKLSPRREMQGRHISRCSPCGIRDAREGANHQSYSRIGHILPRLPTILLCPMPLF